MDVYTLNQGGGRNYPSDSFGAGRSFRGYCRADSAEEAMNGLRSIIRLSMYCLDLMLRNGGIQRTINENGLARDNDPYVEGVLNIMERVSGQRR